MKQYPTEWIVFMCIETFLGLLIVFCNATILIAINRKHALHTVTSVFVGNLATADLLVGMTIGPLSVLTTMELPKNKLGCISTQASVVVFTNVSIITLLSIAIERFVAIRMPYFYLKSITVSRAFISIGFIWVLGISLALSCVEDWSDLFEDLIACRFRMVMSQKRKVFFETGGLLLAPIGIMICIYSYIIVVVRRHTVLSVQLQRPTHSVMTRANKRRTIKDFSKQARGVKMFALLILTFATLWLPFHVINFLLSNCGHNDSSCLPPEWIYLGSIVLTHLHSCTNPIICAYSNSGIIHSVRSMFCKLGPGDSQRSGETSAISRFQSYTI